MPSLDPSPPIALLTEVDARAWRGVELMLMAGGVGPKLLGPATDYFEDALNFLNGRCSSPGADLDALVKTVKGATWSIYLNGDDRVVIEDTSGIFILKPGGGREAFGFANSAVGDITSALVGAGPIRRITASADWVRGNVENKHLIIKDGGGATDNIPYHAYRAQDVVTMLRASTLVDADSTDAAANLESQTVAAYGAPGQYRWGLNADGHVWLASLGFPSTEPNGVGVWRVSDFQEWLGFDGTETTQTLADATTGDDLKFIEAMHPCEGAIMPSRPLMRPVTHRYDETTNTARLTSGEIASNKVMGFESVSVEWWIDGPADSRDLSTHWLNAVVPRAAKGVRWTLYQVWGDSRRVRHTVEARTTGLVGSEVVTPAYDLLATAELDGRRGRIRGRRGISDKAKKANKWPGSLLRRIPMTTILENAED